MAERHDDRSSEEIRRDIEGTRTELRETVTALERKLSLGQVVDEVWGRVGGREAAGDAVSNLRDTIRENPVPLALMGLGVAWLAVEKATGSDRDDVEGRRVRRGTHGRAEGRVGPYRGDAVHGSSGPSSVDKAKHKASEAADKAKGMASDVASKAKDLASDAKGKLSDAKDGFGSSNGDSGSNGEAYGWDGGDEGDGMSDRAMEGARRGVKKARHGLRAAMDEQPLALGAVAFGLGLASGLSVPTTSWEDDTMGEAADAVKEEAGSMAKDVTRDVKQAAASAGSAAKEEMHDRDLDFDGMKDRAQKTRERTEDRLTD